MAGDSDDGDFDVGEPIPEWESYQGAPTGAGLECEGWHQALRILGNNLDPEVVFFYLVIWIPWVWIYCLDDSSWNHVSNRYHASYPRKWSTAG